jgi:hypothetical protein
MIGPRIAGLRRRTAKPGGFFPVEHISKIRRQAELLPSGAVFLAALAVCSVVSFKAQAAAAGACDLNQDGLINNADVTLAVNMALGTTTCSANVEGPNTCTVITVQRVIDAALGQSCLTYNGSSNHSVTLNWVASVTPSVSYNVYRGTVSTGPYTKVNSSLISGTAYTDSAVQAGQTYYYVATAVDINGNESAFSSPAAQAVIPTP